MVLLSRKRTHYLDEIQWPCYNRSSVILPIICVLYNYPPILVPSIPPTSGSEICSLPTLGVCTVGGHVPDFVATRTATLALSGLEHHRPSVEPLGALPLPQSPIVYESLADLEGVSVGFPAPSQPIIIIHVRSCLLGLLAIAAPDAPLAKVEGLPPVNPTRKRNNKKKKKAGKGSKIEPPSTTLTLSSIPTSSTIANGDEGG
ncbi:hypothetical protein FRC10_006623, partial [Ceratobasidium sp. 414]